MQTRNGVLIFMLLLLFSQAEAQQGIIFNDDFSDFKEGWQINRQPISYDFKDGRFEIVNGSAQGDNFLVRQLPIDFTKHWYVEVKIFVDKNGRNGKRQEFGIVWGDTLNINVFKLNADGLFETYQVGSGAFNNFGAGSDRVDLFPNTQERLFGKHVLRLEHRNGGLYYYLDNKRVFAGVAPLNVKLNYAGFYIGDNSSLKFDNFEVGMDKTAPTVLPKKIMSMSGGVQFAFINEKGEKLSANRYDEAKGFVDGVAIVKKDNLYGLADSTGKEITACKYTKIENAVNGIFKVQRYGFHPKSKQRKFYYTGYVNRKGVEIIPANFGGESEDFTKTALLRLPIINTAMVRLKASALRFMTNRAK